MPTTATRHLIDELIAFDTTSRNSNLDLIDHVAGYLKGFGIDSLKVFDATGAKANLFATIGPADVPGLVLSGHTDVVPVDGQDWSTDPFTVAEKDGRLYGRGTADMKSFAGCVLAKVPDMVARPLKTPIHIALSYDEEIGCIGVRRLLEMMRDWPVRPMGCIVGEPTGMEVVVAHKGKKSMRVTVTGKAAHSSLAPHAVNAVEYAARLVVFIREMGQKIMRDGARDNLFDVPFTTAHTGVIAGGTQLNIVPELCTFEFEFRSLPAEDPTLLVAAVEEHARTVLEPEMRAIAPETGIAFAEISAFPGLETAPDAPIVGLAKAFAGKNGHIKVAYGTEAGLFTQTAGVPTIVCGPGNISEAHKPDEYVALDQIDKCEAFLDRLIAHCRG